MCHNIIAFHYILIATVVKPTSKTKNTTQAKIGNAAKASTTGKKRSALSKNISTPISNKQRRVKVLQSMPLILLLPLMTKDDYSIVDQDVDVDVVLAGVTNHSFLSLQASDNHFGVEYNATVYDGGKNTVAAVHLSRLSASPSLANVAASIAPDLSTLSRNGLIAAANGAMRVQRSLEREVAALQ